MPAGRTLLALAGSPRRGGNTDRLLEWTLSAAEEQGARVVVYHVCDLAISGCTGCETCLGTGACTIQDDFELLLPHLLSAESLVLAAPIFALGVPSQVKAFIDRCQPFWAKLELLHEPVWPADRPDRRAAWLSVSGSPDPSVFEGARRTVRYLWHVLGARSVGELAVPAMEEAGAVERQAGARGKAEDIGRRLAVADALGRP